MSERLDEVTGAWPLRPWIMAAICGVAGLIFHFLVDHTYDEPLAPLRQAGATFVVVATLSFVITVEKRRWLWTIGFGLAWGIVIAFVGWFTARYNVKPTIFEWPYWSGLLAVLIAAPLFQTLRDEGRWSFPYERLHGHAWADAVIGAAGLAFTGIVFMFAFLVGGLFDLIGIEAIKKLLQKEWFDWMLAGLAFGAAVGLLRERDRLLPLLQRLLRIVLAVLAPPLAVALVLFLASIPFTGLEKFWKSGVPATPLLLMAGANAILLSNTIFGENAENRSANPVLRWASLSLIAVVLPLAAIAALSMEARIEQYGWTPERMWGVIAIAVAIAYGFAGWYAIWRGRLNFDEPLRPLQTAMAIGLCGIALFLALPILDFGAISARSQLARLESGQVSPTKFDWSAMAFEFGPAGRRQLEQVAQTGPVNVRDFAKGALKSNDRYDTNNVVEEVAQAKTLESRVRILSPGIVLTPALRKRLTGYDGCENDVCALLRIDADRLLLIKTEGAEKNASATILDLKKLEKTNGDSIAEFDSGTPAVKGVNLRSAAIEVRPVSRRQAFVNGQPVGDPFE